MDPPDALSAATRDHHSGVQVVAGDLLLGTAHELAHAFTDGRSPVASALTRAMIWSTSAAPHARP